MYRTENDFLHDDNDGSTDGGIILKLQPQRTISSLATAPRRIFQQPDFFVMTQIQRQLTKEICWLIVGIFCVCVMEAQSIMSPSPVNIASVIYECVSAFGCVGGSLGGMTPGTSQSADYQPTSKLVIILLMYRGRHRSLPAKIDRAVLLPSEQLERSDTEEQHLYRLHRSPSCVTAATTGFNHNYRHSVNIKVYQRSETL
jgi:Trk-type K+ transport system membrane component